MEKRLSIKLQYLLNYFSLSGQFDPVRVTEIKYLAEQNGMGFFSGCVQKVALILHITDPYRIVQINIIE